MSRRKVVLEHPRTGVEVTIYVGPGTVPKSHVADVVEPEGTLTRLGRIHRTGGNAWTAVTPSGKRFEKQRAMRAALVTLLAEEGRV